jgi:hypothetical protein
MLYEKLNTEMQKMVDEYASRLVPFAWGRRADLLIEAAHAFGEELGPERAGLAARGFLTAVLERWGERPEGDELEDPRQVCLYLASLDAEHRARAERYLEAHPEMREVVSAALGPDDRSGGSGPEA